MCKAIMTVTDDSFQAVESFCFTCLIDFDRCKGPGHSDIMNGLLMNSLYV